MDPIDHRMRFVELRQGVDGTPRYLWRVPETLHVPDWTGPRHVWLSGQGLGPMRTQPTSLVERVALEAERRNAALDLMLLKGTTGNTLGHVALGWMGSDRWEELSQDRKKTSAYLINRLVRWSAQLGHPPVAHYTLGMVETYLRDFKDRPSLRLQLRSLLNILFERATDEHLITRSPITSVSWTEPKSKTEVWREDDVDVFVEKALEMNQPGLAGVIITMWRTAQRAGDVRSFRHGVHYQHNHFLFDQSKTNRRMRIGASLEVREAIDRARTTSDFLFTTRLGKPFTRESLWKAFEKVRAAAFGYRRLQLRALRHSCVMRLARHRATVLEIAGLTGHKVGTVQKMIEHYFGADDELTRQALILDLKGSGRDLSHLPDPVPRFDIVANDNDWQGDAAGDFPHKRRR